MKGAWLQSREEDNRPREKGYRKKATGTEEVKVTCPMYTDSEGYL